MLLSLLIVLGILLAARAIMQVLLRRKWVRERAEVATVLRMDPDILAREHPTQLGKRLGRVRYTEAIHTDFMEHEVIRERDRESARTHVARAREATAKIRVAMAASVKNRVDAGVVIPSMPGATAISVAGSNHD